MCTAVLTFLHTGEVENIAVHTAGSIFLYHDHSEFSVLIGCKQLTKSPEFS